MTGDAFTNECYLGKHEDCRNDIIGFKGEHVNCTCSCHKKETGEKFRRNHNKR
jgi:hypothetical protein